MKSILCGLMGGLVALTLVAGCGQKAEQGAALSNRVEIAVTENGYEPATVTVAAGKPVTLVVTRQTDKTCATEVVLKEHNINQPLPLGQTVEITFTPDKPGELTYACAMDMYKGKVIVK